MNVFVARREADGIIRFREWSTVSDCYRGPAQTREAFEADYIAYIHAAIANPDDTEKAIARMRERLDVAAAHGDEWWKPGEDDNLDEGWGSECASYVDV